MTKHGSDIDRSAQWESFKARHLRPLGERPASAARGLHHFALLCSDVERTITFYQGLLEFPLVELFENRDYRGSTHFFFDIGHGNYLAFFDFPGLDLGAYREVLGGLHHIAISVTPEQLVRLGAKLEAAGVEQAWHGPTALCWSRLLTARGTPRPRVHPECQRRR